MIYTDNESIVKEYKKLLIDNGIKQQYIADKLGVQKQSVNQTLNKVHITFDDMEKLIGAIGYKMEIRFVKSE